ncbi:hypothetical protein JW823_10420 [bacterium]|nr:hypothetical protein [candidate division CSSED10-310 bacterium]
MPEMMEIYKKHASEYDELVRAEDYRGHLRSFLRQTIDWNGKIICEAGIGTGRVTRFYIDLARRVYGFDRELHMLDRCRRNLSDYRDKLVLETGLNEKQISIPEPADIFVEGWSFGHTISERHHEIVSFLPALLNRVQSLLRRTGTIILIETLGTNVSYPVPPTKELVDFYRLLEERHGFQRHVIETDYRFGSRDEAARVMGFFFGDEMRYSVKSGGQSIILEYTGVWIKRLSKGDKNGHQRVDHSDAV